jgi:3'-phosphoadenosine 5'-phosphosulfate sulfotransferase (PAPS reductase)/FAD synthetase
MRSSSQELDSQSVVSQNMNYEVRTQMVVVSSILPYIHMDTNRSCQQMLSLADRIGNVNRGLSEAARDALPTRVHRNKENKNKEDDKYILPSPEQCCHLCLPVAPVAQSVYLNMKKAKSFVHYLVFTHTISNAHLPLDSSSVSYNTLPD